jgi:hypothetical protein
MPGCERRSVGRALGAMSLGPLDRARGGSAGISHCGAGSRMSKERPSCCAISIIPTPRSRRSPTVRRGRDSGTLGVGKCGPSSNGQPLYLRAQALKAGSALDELPLQLGELVLRVDRHRRRIAQPEIHEAGNDVDALRPPELADVQDLVEGKLARDCSGSGNRAGCAQPGQVSSWATAAAPPPSPRLGTERCRERRHPTYRRTAAADPWWLPLRTPENFSRRFSSRCWNGRHTVRGMTTRTLEEKARLMSPGETRLAAPVSTPVVRRAGRSLFTRPPCPRRPPLVARADRRDRAAGGART